MFCFPQESCNFHNKKIFWFGAKKWVVGQKQFN